MTLKKLLLCFIIMTACACLLLMPAAAVVAVDPVMTNKNSIVQEDGTIRITLEAYATGEVVTKHLPADIVLVLDQSGSMAYGFGNKLTVDQLNTSKGEGYYCYWNRDQTAYPLRYNGTAWQFYNEQWNSVTNNSTISSNLYQSREGSLKETVTDFVASVTASAGENNIDHRIAIVGYASQTGYGNNTEILSIDGTNSGIVGVAYNSLNSSHYAAALVDTNTSNGQTLLTNAVAALASEGATRSDLGMNMAVHIFENDTKAADYAAGNRVRAVIMFTDGVPTNTTVFDNTVANNSIAHGRTLNQTHGADVYTVGIFDGADPSVTNASGTVWPRSVLANRFMNYLSSNYPDQANMGLSVNYSDGQYTVSDVTNPEPSATTKYLAASDSTQLSTVFSQIASEIQGAGVSNAVVTDIVQPQFEFPSFAGQPDPTQVTAFVGTVNVTENISINMADNSISLESLTLEPADPNNQTDIDAKKLVITFIVQRRPDFIGGNVVSTNADCAIYAEDGTRLAEFPQPEVDLEIRGTVSIAGGNKSVYIGDSVGFGTIQAFFENVDQGLPFQINGTDYTTDGENNKYVDITYTIKDASAQTIGEYKVPAGSVNGVWTIGNADEIVLSESTVYTITADISPINPGSAVQTITTDPVPFNVFVFKPVVNTQDIAVYLSQTPDLTTAAASVVWQCADHPTAALPVGGGGGRPI